MKHYDAIIFGAGPSGIATAIYLARAGWRVAIIEKSPLPREKACGGFLGMENFSLWKELGIADAMINLGTHLTSVNLITRSHQSSIPLKNHQFPWGALGLSRYHYDDLLYRQALQQGVNFYTHTISTLESPHQVILIQTHPNGHQQRHELTCQLKINARGATTQMTNKTSGLFGASATFSNVTGINRQQVNMYFIPGAHVGINPCENNMTNVGFVADASLAQRHQYNLDAIWQLFMNHYPELRKSFKLSEGKKFKGIFINPHHAYNFGDIKNNVINVGDSVGCIHPLFGAGTNMALASAKLLSSLLINQYKMNPSINTIINQYQHCWHKHFQTKFVLARFWGTLSHYYPLTSVAISFFETQQKLLNHLYQSCHQQPLLERVSS